MFYPRSNNIVLLPAGLCSFLEVTEFLTKVIANNSTNYDLNKSSSIAIDNVLLRPTKWMFLE